MAKYPLPADTFAPVVLSQDDARRLEAAAEEVVKRTVQQYHEHLTVHNGVVDERRWKKIKQREDVRVYRERAGSATAAAASEPKPEHDADHDAAVGNEEDGEDDEFKIISSMLTFGSIQGSLEDVLYGALNPSLRDMRLKSAYVDDGFADWAFVAPIITPSESNPFRELSIKWTVKTHPLLINVVMRARDTLYLDSIGIAQTPSGERIGYQLRHSVDLPEIRELLEFGIVRAKISICHVYRQRKPDCVEVFIRGLVSPMGDAPASLAAATTATISVSVWKNLHSGEMKKLARVLRAVGADAPSDTSSQQSSSSSDSARGTSSLSSASDATHTSSQGSATACELCATSVRTSSSKFSLTRSSSSKSKCCRVCAAQVCSRCRVSKPVHLPPRDSSADAAKVVTETKATICTRCMVTILSASSAQFAVLDARALEGKSVDYAAAVRL